ncbi:MAG: hypothetical protein ACOC1E_02975 [Marinilabiliaceae bacterium]
MQYTQYLPIDPDFYEILDKEIRESDEGKVFFFQPDNNIGQAEGKLTGLHKEKNGEFLAIYETEPVRLDRIITINGKPGPAYDEYDAYANACLSCQAGYEE